MEARATVRSHFFPSTFMCVWRLELMFPGLWESAFTVSVVLLPLKTFEPKFLPYFCVELKIYLVHKKEIHKIILPWVSE